MRVTTYFSIAAKFMGHKNKMDHGFGLNNVFALRKFVIEVWYLKKCFIDLSLTSRH